MKNLLFGISLAAFTFVLSSCGYKEAQLRERNEVQALITDHRAEIQSCYDEAIKKNPQLPSGSMTVRAYQNIDGSIHSAQLLKGFAGSTEVIECTQQKVNSWKTSPPQTWGPLEFTFHFTNVRPVQKRIEEDLISMMKANRSSFVECYSEAIKKNPKIGEGKIAFEFQRTQDGRIDNLNKKSGFPGSEPVFECMTAEMKKWTLSEATADLHMNWVQEFKR